MTPPNDISFPIPSGTGTRDSYHWLSTTEHGISNLLAVCPTVVLGKYLAVTSCDSGPLPLDDVQKLGGWEQRGGIAYSPRIESLDMVPAHDLYDEWYIFGVPFDLGIIRQGNIFDHPISLGHVEVFVNFYGFSLDAPEVQDLVSRFWRQLEWIRPEAYVAQGDYGFMTFVTREAELFATVRQSLHTRKC